MAAEKESLQTKLRSTVLDPNSRLFIHTKASQQKLPGKERRENLVPTQSMFFTEAGGPENPAYVSVSPARPGSRLQEFRNRDFGGHGAFALLRGGELPRALTPDRRSLESTHSTLIDSPMRSRTPSWAGGVARVGSLKNVHTAGTLFPTNVINAAEPPVQKGLWLAKPLSDGTRVLAGKRRVMTPPPSSFSSLDGSDSVSRTNSPKRLGRKLLQRQDNLQGASLAVAPTNNDKPRVMVRRHEEHYSQQAPYSEPGNGPIEFQNQVKQGIGLLGFGPTGRRRFELPATSTLLDFEPDKERITANHPPVTGPRQVPPMSHKSVVVWDLKSYTPDELNEKKWKSSSVPLDGPPAFTPQESQRRASRSPCRRRIDVGTSNIFPVGEPPALANPHHPAHLRVGLGIGRYSPLRQQPPGFPRN
jgi:hypothetical protein